MSNESNNSESDDYKQWIITDKEAGMSAGLQVKDNLHYVFIDVLQFDKLPYCPGGN